METFTDPRDDNVYKIVKIGNLYWFAENLRYQGVDHYFPDRNSDNIQKYGCLYTWDNAIKVCPSGWRLPKKAEFDDLLEYVNKNKSSSSTSFLSLIANSAAWKDYSNQGLGEFGFGALPAGSYYSSSYDDFGYYGLWWSATEYDSSFAYYLHLGNDDVGVSYEYKTDGYSVRYVKEI